jgi:hypothetical protein
LPESIATEIHSSSRVPNMIALPIRANPVEGTAGAILPEQLAGLLLEGINITAFAASVRRYKKFSFVQQGVAMEAARTAIGSRIVRPHFSSGLFVQRIQFARS